MWLFVLSKRMNEAFRDVRVRHFRLQTEWNIFSCSAYLNFFENSAQNVFFCVWTEWHDAAAKAFAMPSFVFHPFLLFPTLFNSCFTKHALYIFQKLLNCANDPTVIYVQLCLCAQGRTELEASTVSSTEGEWTLDSQNDPRRCCSWRKFLLSVSALCESGLCSCHCLSMSPWNCSRDRTFFFYDFSITRF